jgi:hypothetical protein
MRIFLVAALLVVSSTLMAKTSVRSNEKSIGTHQTELLVKTLDLTKKQANKILAINQKNSKKEALLFAQRNVIERMGYMDASVQKTFMETLAKNANAKNQEIKSILKGEQLVAFENMKPTFKRMPMEPTHFMGERI